MFKVRWKISINKWAIDVSCGHIQIFVRTVNSFLRAIGFLLSLAFYTSSKLFAAILASKILGDKISSFFLHHKVVNQFRFFRDYFLVDPSLVGERGIYNAKARL